MIQFLFGTNCLLWMEDSAGMCHTHSSRLTMAMLTVRYTISAFVCSSDLLELMSCCSKYHRQARTAMIGKHSIDFFFKAQRYRLSQQGNPISQSCHYHCEGFEKVNGSRNYGVKCSPTTKAHLSLTSEIWAESKPRPHFMWRALPLALMKDDQQFFKQNLNSRLLLLPYFRCGISGLPWGLTYIYKVYLNRFGFNWEHQLSHAALIPWQKIWFWISRDFSSVSKALQWCYLQLYLSSFYLRLSQCWQGLF